MQGFWILWKVGGEMFFGPNFSRRILDLPEGKSEGLMQGF